MRANTDWFKDAKWGVFTHYIGGGPTADDWNRQIDNFDVDKLSEQLAEVGAGYYFITLGQCSGYYCSPNETYDSIAKIKPSKCSKRDLISDIADALAPKGIRVMVYNAACGPWTDQKANKKFGYEWGFQVPDWAGGHSAPRTGKRQEEYQLKWEACLADWSRRWGKKVWGHWLDGVYFADEMYRFPDRPNFQSFASALKAGNPDALVAFNPGVYVPVISVTEEEDFTAGELDSGLPWHCDLYPINRFVDGAQYHVLNFLGRHWGHPEPRFPDCVVAEFTKHIISREGVVSWDVPLSKEGAIPDVYMKQLSVIGKAVRGNKTIS